MRSPRCHGRRAGASSAVALGSGALALLAPKCPACVALWLSGLGLGAGIVGAVAPFLRTAAVVGVIGGLVVALGYLVAGKADVIRPPREDR